MLSLDIEPHNDQDNDESSFYDRLFSEYTKTPEQIYIEKETYEEIHHALDMISLFWGTPHYSPRGTFLYPEA